MRCELRARDPNVGQQRTRKGNLVTGPLPPQLNPHHSQAVSYYWKLTQENRLYFYSGADISEIILCLCYIVFSHGTSEDDISQPSCRYIGTMDYVLSKWDVSGSNVFLLVGGPVDWFDTSVSFLFRQ